MRGRKTLLALACAMSLATPALAHPKLSAEERNELFTAADADGDGKLNATEFATLHDLVRQKMDQQRFARLDTDHDGALTSAELEAGLAARRGKRGRHGG